MKESCVICHKLLKSHEYDVCTECENKYDIETEKSHEQMRKQRKKGGKGDE